MNASTHTCLLTEKQIQDFNRDGFVVVKRLIGREEVDQLVSDYDKALKGEINVPTFSGTKKVIDGGVLQLANPSRHISHWQSHAYFRNALDIARQLLGDDLEYFYDQIIYKPPHHPGVTDWHQDAGYWSESGANSRAVTCWLALSPAFRENGSLQFIPGSHKGEVQEHRRIDSEINNALATNADPNKAVFCTLEPGDASFHHCRTLHYAGGNTSDVQRRALITHFRPKVKTA